MSSEVKSLSLVICTRDRSRRLSRCLDAVRAMTKPSGFELVIVDNNSSDDTASVIRTFASDADFMVTLAFEPIPGLARARNRGIMEATGNIISFTDDDCYVATDFAQQVIHAFDGNKDLGFMGGRILLHDPDDYPITINESTDAITYRPCSFIPAGAIQGANFSFRSEALRQAGGFDIRLGAGTSFPSEDIEIVGRLSQMGWHGLYAPGPTVRHHHGRKSKEDVNRLMKHYDWGRGAYYAAMMRYPSCRISTIKHWFFKMRQQHLHSSFREIMGAFRYITHS